MKKTKKTLERINKILEFCNKEKKHIDEIIEHLDKINIHTLRSKYLYPLVKEGKLIKLPGRWYMTQRQKDKTHQELVKEIWDDADKSFIKVFDKPLDESLRDIYPDAFQKHQEFIKEKWDDADKSAMDILDEPINPNLDDPIENFLPPKRNEKTKK